jgi:hypothetical protein
VYTNFPSGPADMACLLSIQLSAQRGTPMQSLPRAAVETGKGLYGDRFFAGKRPITLLDEYSLHKLCFDTQLPLQCTDLRRNLLIRGMNARDLLGKTFWIGDIPFQGLAPCPPCRHLHNRLQQQYALGISLANWQGGIVITPLARGTLKVGDGLRLG